MNVVVNGYVGKKNTGIARYLVNIIKNIALLDESVIYILYTNYNNKYIINYNFPSNVKIKKISVTKNSSILNILYNSFIFPINCWLVRADLIYVANFMMLTLYSSPVVSVIHDLIEFNLPKKFSYIRVAFRKFVVPRMAKKSKYIITPSNSSKNDIVKLFHTKESKILVIYNGYDFLCNDLVKSESYFKKDKYILYVGTVDYPGKNIHGAVKAFEHLKVKYKHNLKFMIAGMPGKDFKVVKEIVNNSFYRHDIVLLGYVSDIDLDALYKNASVFIFPSFYEGFGLPILEAMVYGVPVITSDKSSLPEVAGNAALISCPYDYKQMAVYLNDILSNEKTKKELVLKGYENLKRFSWLKASELTLQVFRKAWNEHEKKSS